jgi:hypothetical protein
MTGSKLTEMASSVRVLKYLILCDRQIFKSKLVLDANASRMGDYDCSPKIKIFSAKVKENPCHGSDG